MDSVGNRVTGGARFNLRAGIVLDATNLHTVNLSAGLFTASTAPTSFTFGLRNPQLVDCFVSGFSIELQIRTSDSIHYLSESSDHFGSHIGCPN